MFNQKNVIYLFTKIEQKQLEKISDYEKRIAFFQVKAKQLLIVSKLNL